MKLNVAGSKATGTAIEGSQQFGMAMNAKAFHTLSSTLYKDKYGAIVREISSNAYDAHIMAGTPERPFVLTFPDRIDSELIIRDFGPGISPEDMANVYCRFFESTKDQSNEAVGAFGLGCKTPFSYTDTFTVTSIYDGVKRIYTAYKDQGMPNLKLMSESETDEESGLEVCIPVQGKDISSFEKAVLRELRFFAVKPKSNRNWNWPKWETDLDFGSVQFFKTEDDVLRGFFVQIGPVGYRIDKEMINEYADKKGIRLSAMTKHLLDMSTEHSHYHYRRETHSGMLDMPIGTVEVQPSREGLHYTEDTCQNIIDAVNDAETKVAKEMVKRLDAKYTEGCKAFFDMVNSMPSFLRGSLAQIQNFKNKYKPFKVSTSGDIGLEWDKNKVNSGRTIIGKIAPTEGRRYGSVGKTEKTSTRYLMTTETDYSGNVTVKSHGLELFQVDTVYVKDEAFAYKSRIREHDDAHASVFIEPGLVESADNLIAYFEQYVDIVRVSELDKNVSRAGSSTTGGKVRTWWKLGEYLKGKELSHLPLTPTLYSRGVDSVFNAKLDDIDVPTVVVRTHNNKFEYTGMDQLVEKMRLAAMLVEAGYEVIAIPKNVKYDNEYLCELDALTDDHHKALEDILNEVRHTQALRYAKGFVDAFNGSVHQMFQRMWLTGKQTDYTIDFDPLDKALEKARTLSEYRGSDDLEVAKNAAGADDVQISYKDMDELFELANETAGTQIVPSELLTKIENDVSRKAVMTDYANGNIWEVKRIAMEYATPITEDTFAISPRSWMMKLVDGLD